MSSIFRTSLILAVLCLSATEAHAQPQSGASGVEVPAPEPAKDPIALEGGPVTKAGVSAPAGPDAHPVFQLLNDGDNFDLAIAYSYSLDSSRLTALSSKKARWKNTSTRISLKGSVPLGGKEEISTFDFKQVGIGTKATLGISHSMSDYTKTSWYYEVFESALWECAKAKNVASWDALKTEYYSAKASPAGKDETPSAILDGLIKINSSVIKPLRAACVPTGDLEMIGEYAKLADYERLMKQEGFGTIKFFGLDATLAADKFDYIDQIAFEEKSNTPVAFEIAGFAGIVFPRSSWSMKGTLSYARGYENQDKGELCRTVGVDQVCLSGPLGKPDKKESVYASGEMRWYFPLGADRDVESGRMIGPRIAIAPEVTLDLDSGEWAVDVPIFLKRNTKGILDAGVRFGYRSDKDDFGVGLFVSTPFPGF